MRNLLIRTGAIGAAVVSALGLTSFALASTSSPARLAQAAQGTRPAALTAAARVPACSSGELQAWIAADLTASDVNDYYLLEFTNSGGQTCTLYGYPGVSGLDASGQQVGAPAQWTKFATPRTVTLAPGQTAHAQVAYLKQLIGSECTYVEPVTELRVYPPGQRGARHAFLPVDGITINRPYLEVGPLQPGF
ncbi:MAG TPA: DUF4232 domain-containing protein [Streptosporangiaceae bacterium]|nr:DUF4232 domain-containing protein [Streptosporangiaceae bacterium]